MLVAGCDLWFTMQLAVRLDLKFFFLFLCQQKGIMDIVFEIFQLKEPDWTDDFSIALLSVGKVYKF